MQFDHQTTNVLIAAKCGCVVNPPHTTAAAAAAAEDRSGDQQKNWRLAAGERDSCVYASVCVEKKGPSLLLLIV